MSDEEIYVSLKEFFQICRKGRYFILKSTLICVFATTLFALTRPVLYQAEGTFLDKGMMGEENQSSLSSLLLQGASSKKSEAIPLLESTTLMEEMIKEHGLQATINPLPFPQAWVQRLWQNLLTSYAHLTASEYPILSTPRPGISLTNIQYSREVPLELLLTFSNRNTFKVVDTSGKSYGEGYLNTPFYLEEAKFTAEGVPIKPHESVRLKLSPLKTVAKQLQKQLKIKADKETPAVLYLTLNYPDRTLSATLVNDLMTHYKGYLKEKRQHLVDEQLAYLQKRQKEMGHELKVMMQEYATTLSSEYTTAGFPDAEKAMNFLACSMQECKQQLLQTKLDMRHYSHGREGEKKEFQGIDVQSAKSLLMTYTRDLGETEASISQYAYLLKRLEAPDFKISSLSSTLNDPVSQEIIAKASALSLSLYDENNRSQREQERIKGDLAVQKEFLSLHLGQTLHLLQLKQELLQNKIITLQETIHFLTQEEIAILEMHQKELQDEVAKLPQKWVSEKLLNQQMQFNEHMVDELTKLTDSKNIARNLEVVQSFPIDLATPPLHPKNPNLLFFILGGAILGLSLSTLTLLTRSLTRSESN